VLFTIGIFLTGLFSGDLRGFSEIVEVSPAVAQAVALVGWIVPAFSAFDVKAQVVHGVTLPAGFLAWTTLYALVYVLALLTGAVTIFSRREFK
jgi:hypothetical protein